MVHARLRGGPAFSGRGAAHFLAGCFARLRAAGATGAITVRADSGFYSGKVVRACCRASARFPITGRLNPQLRTLIGGLPEEAWTPIPYWLDGAADVAETTYRPFGDRDAKPVRLIVRRVKPTPGSRLALIEVYSYHAFITDCAFRRFRTPIPAESEH